MQSIRIIFNAEEDITDKELTEYSMELAKTSFEEYWDNEDDEYWSNY